MIKLTQVAVFAFVSGLIFFFTLSAPVDFDLGTHLRYGEYILSTKSIPSKDFLTHTYFGQPYNSFEWLYEILTFLTFQKFSLFGLTILSTIIGFASFYFLIRLFSNPIFKILSVIFAGFIASPIILEGLRPQLIGILGISLLIFILIKLDDGIKKYALFLPIVFLLWSNIHTSFAFGLAIIGFYWINKLIKVLVKKETKMNLLFLTMIFVATGLASTFGFLSFSSPANIFYVSRYVLYPPGSLIADAEASLAKNTILEWMPLPLSSYPGTAYLIFVLITGVIFIFWLKKFSLWQIMTIILFSYLAGLSRRHLAIFSFSVCPITLLVVERNLKVFSFPRLGSIVRLILFSIFTIVIIIIWANMYQKTSLILLKTRNIRDFSAIRNNPYLAVEYLHTHPQKGNMYNPYNWGGFLDWQLPESKVFIDGRLTGRKVFADNFKILNVEEGWYETLESYNVSWVIAPTQFKLVKALVDEKGWQKVYEDSIATIVVRLPLE